MNFIKYINIDKVVVEEEGYEGGRNGLMDWANFGCELEFSRLDSYQQDCQKVEEVIFNILSKQKKYEAKSFYRMYGRVEKTLKVSNFKNWEMLSFDQLDFLKISREKQIYPIFINEPAYTKYYCVLVEKISNPPLN